MKRTRKFLTLISLACLLLVACQPTPPPYTSTKPQERALTFDPSQPIRFPENFQIKDLKPDQKADLYQQLDAITRYDGSQEPDPSSYSQVHPIESQADYEALIQASQDQPMVFVIGFDSCPYCKAFVPKLNQLAKEAQLAVYYYNTDKRQNDDNFDQVIKEVFQIQTAPHAFIVQEGKARHPLNDQSTMAEIEAFVEEAKH